jgi:FkbM family methyltransferase
VNLKDVRNALLEKAPGLQGGLAALARRGLIPRAVWSRLQPMGDVSLTAPGGQTLVYRSQADDHFARRVVWDDFRSWERSTVEYVAGVSGAVRGFWDVGAHTGVYGLLVAAVNPAARIRAFEPNPAVTPMLLGNLAANGLPPDILVPAALSDVTGVAHLEIPGDVTAAHVAAEGIAIRTLRGDDVDDGTPVDLIKIDVEDHELAVLRGMAGLLRRCRPALIVEVADDERLAAVRAFLEPLGYASCSYFTGRGLVPADAHLRREAGHPNFLFLAG